jgi:UDP-4-amino-4-deoxy-L-arabinose formyltransferase/UDP-glucuronic acid dehydrogenase (UDP-4-keto-hexauronic acid decarboxylating)
VRSVVLAYQDIGWIGLDELLALGADVPLVVTHDDDPGENVWFRSVAARAREAGIPVIAPPSANDPAVVSRIAALEPDFLFSFYFREILAPDVLRIARRAALNLHGSLLPRYRGRCPVNWVLVNGERETGVTLHHMDARADRGDIVAQRTVPIADDDTALSLSRRLGNAARMLLRETYPRLVAGTAPRVPQDHACASTFGRRRPEDGRIDWTRPARALYDLVRAVTAPYPGAFTTWRGRRLLVWWARAVDGIPATAPGEVVAIRRDAGVVVATGRGALVLERVQLDGGAEERADEMAERAGIVPGARLGEER